MYNTSSHYVLIPYAKIPCAKIHVGHKKYLVLIRGELCIIHVRYISCVDICPLANSLGILRSMEKIGRFCLSDGEKGCKTKPFPATNRSFKCNKLNIPLQQKLRKPGFFSKKPSSAATFFFSIGQHFLTNVNFSCIIGHFFCCSKGPFCSPN